MLFRYRFSSLTLFIGYIIINMEDIDDGVVISSVRYLGWDMNLQKVIKLVHQN